MTDGNVQVCLIETDRPHTGVWAVGMRAPVYALVRAVPELLSKLVSEQVNETLMGTAIGT